MMKMARTLFLLCGAALAVLAPAAARAQCTGESETGRRLVMEYATRYTPPRPAEVPVVAADQVRPLTGAGDAAVCARLHDVFWAQWRNPDEPKPEWHWTFYEVGDLYYVVADRVTPSVTPNADGTLNISLHWSPIFVVDRGYRVVASIAR
jgi:hypothetical protein